MNYITQSLKLFAWVFFLTGIAYPLTITLIAFIVAPKKASGDLVVSQGVVIGARLIAQQFISDRYFWPRPSAIDYKPLPSGGSNLGPISNALKKQVEQRRASLAKAHHVPEDQVPIELLFTTGSGLDPHISPHTAHFQINRVATARRVSPESVRALVDEMTEGPSLGCFGAPRVNVLMLNKMLDERMS